MMVAFDPGGLCVIGYGLFGHWAFVEREAEEAWERMVKKIVGNHPKQFSQLGL